MTTITVTLIMIIFTQIMSTKTTTYVRPLFT